MTAAADRGVTEIRSRLRMGLRWPSAVLVASAVIQIAVLRALPRPHLLEQPPLIALALGLPGVLWLLLLPLMTRWIRLRISADQVELVAPFEKSAFDRRHLHATVRLSAPAIFRARPSSYLALLDELGHYLILVPEQLFDIERVGATLDVSRGPDLAVSSIWRVRSALPRSPFAPPLPSREARLKLVAILVPATLVAYGGLAFVVYQILARWLSL